MNHKIKKLINYTSTKLGTSALQSRMKKQPLTGRKYFQIICMIKDLYPEFKKDLSKLNNKKNNPIFKMRKR